MMRTAISPQPTFARRRFLSGLAALAAASCLTLGAHAALADSRDQERQIGQQVYQDLANKHQIITSSAYYPVLRKVGARLSDATQPHWYPLNFVIVKGSQANAFSVPGGWVYVNEGLLKSAGNEEELAGVLGHEIGHLQLGHVMTRIHQAQNYNLIGGILSIFIRNPNVAGIAGFALNYSYLNFNRQQEYQADHQGVINAARAGYNPYGTIWFFRRLEKLYGNAGFEQYVQDHPATSDRIARIESFFHSEPATFGRWHDTMPPSNGLATSGAGTALSINQ